MATKIFGQYYSRQWLVTWTVSSHHMNQCCLILIFFLTNKFQGNLNQNMHIFIWWNELQNVGPFCSGLSELLILFPISSWSHRLHRGGWGSQAGWAIPSVLAETTSQALPQPTGVLPENTGRTSHQGEGRRGETTNCILSLLEIPYIEPQVQNLSNWSLLNYHQT